MNTRIAILLVLAATAVGCSSKTYTPTQPVSKILTTVPVDNATLVRLDAAVTLDFGTGVDRAVVERGAHLIAESDMFSVCPDTSMGSHGTMESMMDDAGMLQHLGASHATTGSFSWNAAGTACTFRPESLMQPQTRYMVHMSSEMLGMMREAGVSMMDGRMNTAGDMMLHFRTIPADEHDGHH